MESWLIDCTGVLYRIFLSLIKIQSFCQLLKSQMEKSKELRVDKTRLTRINIYLVESFDSDMHAYSARPL